ncbi:Rho-GAP domain-containing protein [Entamoeba marina]
MDSFECLTPDDLHEWIETIDPKLVSQRKFFTGFIKSFHQISTLSDNLATVLVDTINQFESFAQLHTNGYVKEMAKDATNKMKALKGTLLDVKNIFSQATETIKTTERNVFPVIPTIRKIYNEMMPKKPVDACALCSVHSFNFIQTIMIDTYSISTHILIDMKRLTSTEKYSLDELKSIKEITIPKLRDDLKNEVKMGLETVANQTLEQMLDRECRSRFELPYHFRQMFNFLFDVGYSVTGIFRLAGRADTVSLYSKYPALIHYDEDSTIVIASTLKRILRDLPEPIVPFDMYREIIEATRTYEQHLCDKVTEVPIQQHVIADNPHINKKPILDATPLGSYLSCIQSILSKLPVASTVIRYFVELAIKISTGPSLMTVNNLAICITPCVLAADDTADVTECGFANICFEELVNNYSLIFNSTTRIYSTSPPQNSRVISTRVITNETQNQQQTRSITPPIEIDVPTLTEQSAIDQQKQGDFTAQISASLSPHALQSNIRHLPVPPPKPNRLADHKKPPPNHKQGPLSSSVDDSPIKRKDFKKQLPTKSKTMKVSNQKPLPKAQTNNWNSLIEEMAAKRKLMVDRPEDCLFLLFLLNEIYHVLTHRKTIEMLKFRLNCIENFVNQSLHHHNFF